MSHHHHHPGSLILEMTAAFLNPAMATNTVRMAVALEKAKERLFAPVTNDELYLHGIPDVTVAGQLILSAAGVDNIFYERWTRILREHAEEVSRLERLEASVEPEMT